MRERVFLFFLILAALAIRNFQLSANLLFTFEQGRDFYAAREIANLTKFTLLGPKTDIEGIFHGPGYYYFLSFLFKISFGNPIIVVFLFTLIASLAIIFVYKILMELTGKFWVGAIGAGICVVSWNLIIYARWLSNVSPAIFVWAVFLYLLINFNRSQNLNLLPMVFLICGLLLHFEILNFLGGVYLILLLIIFNRKRIRIQNIFFSSLFLLPGFSTFLIFDLKHHFLLFNGIKNYILAGGGQKHGSLFVFTANYFSGFNLEISNTFAPFFQKGAVVIFYLSQLAASFLVIFLPIMKRCRRDYFFLLFASLHTVLLLPFLKYQALEQFFAGTSVFLIVLLIFSWYLICKTYRLAKYVCLAILPFYLLLNLNYALNFLQKRENVFYHAPNKEVTLEKQLKVFAFMKSYKQPFDFDVFTIPLYHPEGWRYIYDWQKIDKINPADNRKLMFLILEPFSKSFWQEKWLEEYNRKTKLLAKKRIDLIEVQIRKKI